MHFKGTDYKELLTALRGPFVFFPKIGEDKKGERKIYLRHDIDGKIENSVRMARIEAAMGIRSTYFVLNTASYWEYDITNELREIQDLGHEIGWHNDAVQAWHTDQMIYPLRNYISIPLMILRAYGCNVRGTSAHFVSPPNDQTYRNYNLWNLPYAHREKIEVPKFELSEFGLEYECSFIKHDLYQCDSGNKWYLPPGEVVERYNREPITLQLLIHPQWWF